jgi:23S rRNA (uracil1939-C5)-methyltransferase
VRDGGFAKLGRSWAASTGPTPDDHRVTAVTHREPGLPTCPHRPPCPGCPRFGESGIAVTRLAALDAFARVHGLGGVGAVTGSTQGFRHRARLAIRGRPGAPKIGLFQSGSHRVVTVPSCSVHHPAINRAAAVVRGALVDAGVAPYVEGAHAGSARYLQVVVERASQTVQVVVVGNSADPAPLAPCLDLIRDRLGPSLHSLWFNSNVARTNAILGPTFVPWCGPPAVVERFGGAAVHYPPGAFGQSNLEIAGRIVEHVRELVPPGAMVAEFYAGVGAIGLSLLDRVTGLRLNEVAPSSLHGLALGVDALSPTDRAKVEVLPGPAGVATRALDGADVAIVDPPRKGLDPVVLQALCERGPRRLVYVSCGLDTFLRDATRLVTEAGYAASALRAYDLLPYTDHVETVACFERRSE